RRGRLSREAGDRERGAPGRYATARRDDPQGRRAPRARLGLRPLLGGPWGHGAGPQVPERAVRHAQGLRRESGGGRQGRLDLGMQVVVLRDAAELAEAAATMFREHLAARPDLAMAVPAGRTPRRMYARLRDRQAREPVAYGAMSVFSVDELCPPAPADGYFWRQVWRGFLAWAGVPRTGSRTFGLSESVLVALFDGTDN